MQCLQPIIFMLMKSFKLIAWPIEKCPTVHLLGSPLHGLKCWYPSQEKEMVGEHEKTFVWKRKKA